jgi:hypothetical protein
MGMAMLDYVLELPELSGPSSSGTSRLSDSVLSGIVIGSVASLVAVGGGIRLLSRSSAADKADASNLALLSNPSAV